MVCLAGALITIILIIAVLLGTFTVHLKLPKLRSFAGLRVFRVMAPRFDKGQELDFRGGIKSKGGRFEIWDAERSPIQSAKSALNSASLS